MNITIAQDAEFINSIINDPYVKNNTIGKDEEGEIDLSALVASDSHYVLEAKPYGGFLVIGNDVGSISVHSLFLRKTPSRVVLESVQASLELVFIHLDVKEVHSSACSSNVPATRLFHHTGFKPQWERKSPFAEGHTEVFGKITVEEFVLANDKYRLLGSAFHKVAGDHTNHDECGIHDSFVGGTVAMIQSGNYEKAKRFYNKWALLTGYMPMHINTTDRIINVGDMVIHMDEALIQVENIVCQSRLP